MPSVFMTSDLHFGCQSALRYRHRPFDDVGHMNDSIIDNWNSIVAPDDWVWCLGDFAVTDDALEECFPRLNGRIALIRGNHEQARPRERLDALFAAVYDGPVHVKYAAGNHDLWLCHYPVERHGEIYTVTGHIHDLWKVSRRMLNVGQDAWHFRPVPLEWVIEYEEAERKGYWDANAYPDAPLEWRVYVTSKIKRDHAKYEPTLPSLERELLEAGAPGAVSFSTRTVISFPIDAPFLDREPSGKLPLGTHGDPLTDIAGGIVKTGF